MKSSNIQMRQNNMQNILCAIKEYGPISKRELQEKTGLGWATVSVLSNELAEKHLICISGKNNTSSGRKPECLDIDKNKHLLIGVDFNSKGITVVVTDLKGRIQNIVESKFAQNTKECAFSTLFSALDRLIEQYKERIKHIGFAMQGVIDDNNEVSVVIKHIEGWGNIPLKAIIEEKYSVPVVLIHDPECLMKSVILFEPDIISKNVLLVCVNDHGIGMSVITNNMIYNGSGGKFGEIGRTVVAPDSDYMFLDQHCTFKDIVRDYKSDDTDTVSFEEIVSRGRNGDIKANDVFKQFGRYLGIALVNTSNLFNVDQIILHGDFCSYTDLFYDELTDFVRANTYNEAICVYISKMKKDACANGAALYAAEKAIEEVCVSL